MKRTKIRSSQLDNLYLASPCSIPWETMEGDERKRSCGGCSRNVYNISDMSRAEAETFLEQNGTNHCMFFYRRADGTIMTDDCPVALRKIRNRLRLFARVAAGIVALVVALPGALAQSASTRTLKPIRIQYTSNPRQVDPGAAGGSRWIETGRPPAPPVLQVTTYETTPTTPVKTVPEKRKPIDKTQTANHDHSALTPNKNLDTSASDFYTKAKDAEKQGKRELAEFYFDKALESFDKQKW